MPWTRVKKTPLSMGFPRQGYWNGVAISFSRGSSWPRELNPTLLHWQADSLPPSHLRSPQIRCCVLLIHWHFFSHNPQPRGPQVTTLQLATLRQPISLTKPGFLSIHSHLLFPPQSCLPNSQSQPRRTNLEGETPISWSSQNSLSKLDF